MNEAQAKPDWAPDDCPPAVVKLIEDEQYLQDLGLRLMTSDSAELHQAVRKLQQHLGEAFTSGKVVGSSQYTTRPFLVGALVGGLSALALAWLTGLT